MQIGEDAYFQLTYVCAPRTRRGQRLGLPEGLPERIGAAGRVGVALHAGDAFACHPARLWRRLDARRCYLASLYEAEVNTTIPLQHLRRLAALARRGNPLQAFSLTVPITRTALRHEDGARRALVERVAALARVFARRPGAFIDLAPPADTEHHDVIAFYNEAVLIDCAQRLGARGGRVPVALARLRLRRLVRVCVRAECMTPADEVRDLYARAGIKIGKLRIDVEAPDEVLNLLNETGFSREIELDGRDGPDALVPRYLRVWRALDRPHDSVYAQDRSH